MNYERTSAFDFTVSSEAVEHFRRQGRAIRLSVHDASDPILDWHVHEPAPGERPRCVEGDISFYFDDPTAPLLQKMHVGVIGSGTSLEIARANRRIHAHWSS